MTDTTQADPQVPTPPPPAPPEPPVTSVVHVPHKKNNALLLIPVLVLLLAGIGAVTLTQKNTQDVRSHAALTGPTLAISPAQTNAEVGSTVSLGLIMNAGSETVSAAELHLTYDPTALEIQEFTPGAALSVVIVPEKHENGEISVTLGAPPQHAFQGADIVGTLKVKILAAKQSTLTFTDATQVAALHKSTNTLTQATGSIITGTGAAQTNAPTQTPAPPTATPTLAVKITSSPHTSSFGKIVKPTVPAAPTLTAPQTEVQQPAVAMPPPATPIEETPIPKTTAFQQFLSAILRFFQGLFRR